jgi:tRNA(Ile)-lysidine synthase
VRLVATLEAFFEEQAPLAPGEGVVVAFSGGPDSTALLWGMAELARRRGFLLYAAHLDHVLDPGSAGRAAAAAAAAERLRVPPLAARRSVPEARRRGESLEEAGRRVRYGFLEDVRRGVGARWIATAHHRDDQAETVLMRLAQGSGIEGLAGVRVVHGQVVRPLLELSRAALAQALAGAGLAAADDPTNRDLAAARNRVRHLLLPALAAEDPELPARLARMAARARGARAVLAQRLEPLCAVRPLSGGAAMPCEALLALPSELQGFALAALHRQAGARYPAGGAARRELLRQLARSEERRRGGAARAGAVGCDAGGGWRWERRGAMLVLRSPAAGEAGGPGSAACRSTLAPRSLAQARDDLADLPVTGSR